ncbi:bifunctional adenosylcobinamide kinase/adenosylcobinamide-phosphate guanylyltransferase [Colwellia asteriadis]|uniref:Bifunctional adenosylcobalamin biosynthesis protein n=1 Tax=Colwellia asteriadis TaxID=517723 RepID=A0ABP3WIM3_9GAMM
MIHLVLGGARSGKSSFAEQQTLALCKSNNKQAAYIATATAVDDEMLDRIVKHQTDRGQEWQLIECPLLLSEQLQSLPKNQVYLLDCLTLWLNNQLFSVEYKNKTEQAQHLNDEMDQLIATLAILDIDIVIVSNEIGLGVIPMGAATRLYVDYCGWLNQAVAKVADQVTLVTAGIPLTLKKA